MLVRSRPNQGRIPHNLTPANTGPHVQNPQKQNLLHQAGAASLGIEMGAAVAVGYLVGVWVDGQLGTDPWGMAFFLAAGLGAGVKAVLRVVRQAQDDARQADAQAQAQERRDDALRAASQRLRAAARVSTAGGAR